MYFSLIDVAGKKWRSSSDENFPQKCINCGYNQYCRKKHQSKRKIIK